MWEEPLRNRPKLTTRAARRLLLVDIIGMEPNAFAPSHGRRRRFRRTADLTALRLGRAILAYLALVIAIITLAPFRFSLEAMHGLANFTNPRDLVMNVLLFVPFGFVHQLTRPRGARLAWASILFLSLALSSTVEALQIFTVDRYPSLLDLATNTIGGLLGAWFYAILEPEMEGESTVRTLALELPLMGLVYLLVPLAWLIGLGNGSDLSRRLLILPLAAMAGAIIGTVDAAYLTHRHGRRRRGWGWGIGMSLGWALVAIVPATRAALPVSLAAVSLMLGLLFAQAILTQQRIQEHRRRFELPTLRLVMPLFVLYLLLSSLWPLSGFTSSFSAMLALRFDGNAADAFSMMYFLLEHVGAFTLVGYLTAEYRGRDTEGFAPALPSVLTISLLLALGIQLARGFHPALGASLTLFLLSPLAAIFGGYVYVLQRAHVRALVERRDLEARVASMHTPTFVMPGQAPVDD
jgi:glycopeptide antibiotics resistance protein